MRPEDRQIANGDPRGNIQPPQRETAAAQSAAANLVRTQLDSIYTSQQPAAQPLESQSDQQALPAIYNRTHTPAHTSNDSQWHQYHTAWQDYYQKYYEHYYVGAVQQVHQAYTDHAASLQQAAASPDTEQSHQPELTKEEAIDDLRSQLLARIKQTTKSVRGSRHFVPIAAALVVFILFTFLQYNRVIIANVQAYVTPGEIDPQNIVIDPNASLQVDQKPLLIIPKINVNVPVDYNTKPDYESQMKAMENGVAYFGIPGANSKPGQVGNTVISGHSSNDFVDAGQYKFVFALLERLKPGDIFYLHYNGIRYTYSIAKTQIVRPTEVNALVYPTTKPIVTLITCTPLGTSTNRLLVVAEQVSPNPGTAAAAPTDAGSASKQSQIPGNSPTFVERIFGAS